MTRHTAKPSYDAPLCRIRPSRYHLLRHDVTWLTSSFSDGAPGHRVQAAHVTDGTIVGVLLRDSVERYSPFLSISAHEWRAFCRGIVAHEFDPPATLRP
ncbi:DUF397 domain-containing protein [Frankia sp. AgB1.9]|uniref:DUF397 domain-containing protein n=1 Tax=unclassified Frankia TaxID=2632575 RepID=UPI0019341033|nr:MULTISPECIES: DUF397 domain-containing protein [unclassified Frankia]MBL7493121.1 DUF397 domain-containing protein [Frankia sp. AgW1.1]MBL7550471.1 DUF397 domain-containing protein [Frankia sp. AgB1.9]MBL7624332.1 DUF397 domain-containing protein [Frankia sp. AgB1.8]